MRSVLVLVLIAAAAGCAPRYYVANVYYDDSGTLTQERCPLGKGSRCYSEPVGDEPVDHETGSRYSQIEEVPMIPPADLKPVAVDRTKYRYAAIVLAQRADAAARANDCATAKLDADQINTIDRDFYSTVVLRDQTLVKCLTPSRT